MRYLRNIILAVIIILIDLIIVLGTTYISLYLLKDELDNFFANFRTYLTISPLIIGSYSLIFISYLIFISLLRKTFSIRNITYITSITILIQSLVIAGLRYFIKDFQYSYEVLILSFILQIIILNLWHSIIYNAIKYINFRLKQKYFNVRINKKNILQQHFQSVYAHP